MRNMVGDFEFEAEALQPAREFIVLNATVYPEALALAFEDSRGCTRLLASGAELLALL